jgi:hypothetical protein
VTIAPLLKSGPDLTGVSGGWGVRSEPGSLEREFPRCYSGHGFDKLNYSLMREFMVNE